MEEKKNFEAVFKEDLYQYLLGIDKVDAHLPGASGFGRAVAESRRELSA